MHRCRLISSRTQIRKRSSRSDLIDICFTSNLVHVWWSQVICACFFGSDFTERFWYGSVYSTFSLYYSQNYRPLEETVIYYHDSLSSLIFDTQLFSPFNFFLPSFFFASVLTNNGNHALEFFFKINEELDDNSYHICMRRLTWVQICWGHWVIVYMHFQSHRVLVLWTCIISSADTELFWELPEFECFDVPLTFHCFFCIDIHRLVRVVLCRRIFNPTFFPFLDGSRRDEWDPLLINCFPAWFFCLLLVVSDTSLINSWYLSYNCSGGQDILRWVPRRISPRGASPTGASRGASRHSDVSFWYRISTSTSSGFLMITFF